MCKFRTASLICIAATSFPISACGTSTSVPIHRSLGSTALTTTSTTSSTSTSSTSTTTTTPSPTPSPSATSITGSSPPYSFRVGAVGYTSTTVSVSAGQVLKIKFTPGVQDQAIAGTGVYPNYSMLGVYITVNGVVGATEMLSNGFRGGGAQTSSVMDFSNAIAGSCSNSSCRQSVTITIDHPNNDYWCYNYGQFCPYSWVYNTHPWHGTLEIQTDDTTAI